MKTIYINALFNTVVETTEELFDSYLDNYADKDGEITTVWQSNTEYYYFDKVHIATVVHTR